MKTESSKKKIKPWTINRTKYLLPHEVYKLRLLILRSDLLLRDRLLIRVAISTGARASEILNLRMEDFDQVTKTLMIRGLKNSNDREMPLTPRLFRDLQRYARTVQSDRLFPIKYHCLTQRIWPKYRPVKKRFHSLRHTFAIRLYAATRDLRLVQVALGHRNIKNTMVYAEYFYTVEELKRITVVSI